MQAGGESGALNYIGDWSQFHTDGYRNHSAANRQTFNGKLKWLAGEDTRVTLVMNTLCQPETQDALGLSAAQAAGQTTPGRPVRELVQHAQDRAPGADRRHG